MIRILSLHSSAFCKCSRAEVADTRFHPFYSSNKLEGHDLGATVTRSRCTDFVRRLTRSLSFRNSWIGNPRHYGSCNKRVRELTAVGSILEGDVVEYVQSLEDMEIEGNRKQRKLGVVVSISENASSALCEIDPLRQEEPGSNEWVEDEDQLQVCVPLSQVQVIDAWPSQRMDTDRVSNPHGEHAHNVWLIDPATLIVG